MAHHCDSESEEGYDAIYNNIRSNGWRRLKGYFPTRRHGKTNPFAFYALFIYQSLF